MLNLNIKDSLNLYRMIAGVVAITLILIGCVIVLKPFFPAALLATIFTLATWPAFSWLHQKLDKRTNLSAGLMTVLLSLCFIVPLIIIGTSVADNYSTVYNTVQITLQEDPSKTATQLENVPYAGEYLKKYWLIGMTDRARMSAWLEEHSSEASKLLLTVGSAIGNGLFDLILGVLIAFFLFRHGTIVADRVQNLMKKFGGEHGERLLNICKNTLTGVVYGLLGTALVQGAFAAIGFWIAGVPGASFLGLMVFFLSIVPIGPPLVWIPAALWLLSQGQTLWAIFLIIWGATVIGSIDNILKPHFISRGSNLPFLLVLLGIMGGVLAFGFIGVFLGPTILALSYALILEWSTVRKAVQESS